LNNLKSAKNSVLFILEEGRLAGPQIYLFRLMKKLQIDSRVIFPHSGKEFKHLLDSYNLSNSQIFITAPSIQLKNILLYIFTFIPEILLLTFYFLKAKENVVYVAGGAWQIKGVIAAKLSFKKVVWHLNDTNMPYLVRLIFFILAPLVNGFIFASKASKAYYSDLIPNRFSSVIPSPVDFESLENTTKPSYIHQDKRVIGMVANVNPTKNMEDFILIAHELNKRHTDLHFIIIGPIYDSQSNYHEKLTNIMYDLKVENLTFVGGVENVFEYLERMDVFLFTSKSESSPLAVWEAMLAALPIVSYDVGDVKEYITHLRSGYIAKLLDRNDLVHGVDLFLNNETLSSSMGKEAKKIVESELSSTSCANRHLDYFNKLL
tara:strand:- start:2401 stop:3528 length:1128 start_codon:yes stop_codon:yes gene_type:complete